MESGGVSRLHRAPGADRRRELAFLVLFGGVLALGAAGERPVRSFSLRSGALTYKLVHKLHEVEGTTRSVEGRALLQEDGTAKIQVRAKVASFDSGNSNRDAHMREVTHEPIHSYASLKGTLRDLRVPLSAPVELSLSATVALNGATPSPTTPFSFPPHGPHLPPSFSFPL